MEVYSYDAVVVGSGAAGYQAAIQIHGKTVAMVTEGVQTGTSRNTGSDKQTYYKLSLAGNAPDSVEQMAADLFAGGAVDGDNALCEAALSARCFLHLCELGVEFPTNGYGEYVGYQTDHDTRGRATSAGPLTSKYMTEALERQAKLQSIPVYDGLYAVEILKDDTGVCGLLTIRKATGEYVAFRCGQVILATGGPAGIYARTVYPVGHTGSTGLALAAGAAAQNLTEWQNGLASVSPRWNVSGTYMQVLPRIYSVDENGTEHDILQTHFENIYEALSLLFCKGYQWPFDVRRAERGSSQIDLLVHGEALQNRRVYLDYRRNPVENLDFTELSDEAYAYLKQADACFGTPIERLLKMNAPAVELYRSKGVDLAKEPLEIALCAQHHNGGIAVDAWWQTTVSGLYAVGECAGTHGVARPGGSALNAGQVGGLRAAQRISAAGRSLPQEAAFSAILRKTVEKHLAFSDEIKQNRDTAQECIQRARRRMSDCAAAVRELPQMQAALAAATEDLQHLGGSLAACYALRDLLLTQQAVLTAMVDFCQTAGHSRGSAIYRQKGSTLPYGTNCLDRIQTVALQNGQWQITWRPVRPIPKRSDVFETVWRQYRETKSVF